MKHLTPASLLPATVGLAAALLGASFAQAQTAYGVDSNGILFSFPLSSPGTISNIGDMGFVPKAIDFRPGTSTLYAFGVTGATATLYTVNTSDALATPIEEGFSTSGMVGLNAYDISGATSFAFDFNPTTLQVDTSIRIRLVGNDGSNLRLHSATGGIAAVDGSVNGEPGALLSGAAYTNSDVATMGGPTSLYYIDYANNTLVFSSGPNAGTIAAVGPLEVDVGANLGFDIYSGASQVGYLVDTTGFSMADLYTIDLGTGFATLLTNLNRDFSGGFAIDQMSAIPEPSSAAALFGLLGLGCATLRRQPRRTTLTQK